MNEIIDRGRATNNKSLTYENRTFYNLIEVKKIVSFL